MNLRSNSYSCNNFSGLYLSASEGNFSMIDVETTVYLYESSSVKNKTEMYFVSGLLRELTNAHLKFDNFTMRGSTLQM